MRAGRRGKRPRRSDRHPAHAVRLPTRPAVTLGSTSDEEFRDLRSLPRREKNSRKTRPRRAADHDAIQPCFRRRAKRREEGVT
jgi:hypothetical protein